MLHRAAHGTGDALSQAGGEEPRLLVQVGLVFPVIYLPQPGGLCLCLDIGDLESAQLSALFVQSVQGGKCALISFSLAGQGLLLAQQLLLVCGGGLQGLSLLPQGLQLPGQCPMLLLLRLLCLLHGGEGGCFGGTAADFAIQLVIGGEEQFQLGDLLPQALLLRDGGLGDRQGSGQLCQSSSLFRLLPHFLLQRFFGRLAGLRPGQLGHQRLQLAVELVTLLLQRLLLGGVLRQQPVQKLQHFGGEKLPILGFFYLQGQQGVLMAGDPVHILPDAGGRLLPLGLDLARLDLQFFLQGVI